MPGNFRKNAACLNFQLAVFSVGEKKEEISGKSGKGKKVETEEVEKLASVGMVWFRKAFVLCFIVCVPYIMVLVRWYAVAWSDGMVQYGQMVLYNMVRWYGWYGIDGKDEMV